MFTAVEEIGAACVWATSQAMSTVCPDCHTSLASFCDSTRKGPASAITVMDFSSNAVYPRPLGSSWVRSRTVTPQRIERLTSTTVSQSSPSSGSVCINWLANTRCMLGIVRLGEVVGGRERAVLPDTNRGPNCCAVT